MRILISGASGFVGGHLADDLQIAGHEISKLVRSKNKTEPDCSYWNPAIGELDNEYIEGYDVVIHLSGENIASGRWTSKRKKEIRDSRINSTLLLSQRIAELKRKPKILISASAIGFYGNRGDEILNERSKCGEGFFADICNEWESATTITSDAGIRVVNLRLGILLGENGGALAKMLPAFKLGLGGKMGSGDQFMSWLSIDDLKGIIRFIISNETIIGPINCVSPTPVTNREFTKTLGEILKRPTIFTLPLPFLKLLLGDLAIEITASSRVLPENLLERGFSFRDSALESCLQRLLSINP